MSISDTQSAKKYASIAEVAAAQAKLNALISEGAEGYAEAALASASSASSSANSAAQTVEVVSGLASAASVSALDAANSAASAGSAAADAIGSTVRAPAGEILTELPVANERALNVMVFDGAGDSAVKPIDEFAIIGENGKIPVSVIPSIALTQPFVVSSQEEMLALDVQVGDIAKRTDLGYSFCLSAEPPTSLSNWIQLTDDVLSQLGQSSGASQVGALAPNGSSSDVQTMLSSLNTSMATKVSTAGLAAVDGAKLSLSQVATAYGLNFSMGGVWVEGAASTVDNWWWYNNKVYTGGSGALPATPSAPWYPIRPGYKLNLTDFITSKGSTNILDTVAWQWAFDSAYINLKSGYTGVVNMDAREYPLSSDGLIMKQGVSIEGSSDAMFGPDLNGKTVIYISHTPTATSKTITCYGNNSLINFGVFYKNQIYSSLKLMSDFGYLFYFDEDPALGGIADAPKGEVISGVSVCGGSKVLYFSGACEYNDIDGFSATPTPFGPVIYCEIATDITRIKRVHLNANVVSMYRQRYSVDITTRYLTRSDSALAVGIQLNRWDGGNIIDMLQFGIPLGVVIGSISGGTAACSVSLTNCTFDYTSIPIYINCPQGAFGVMAVNSQFAFGPQYPSDGSIQNAVVYFGSNSTGHSVMLSNVHCQYGAGGEFRLFRAVSGSSNNKILITNSRLSSYSPPLNEGTSNTISIIGSLRNDNGINRMENITENSVLVSSMGELNTIVRQAVVVNLSAASTADLIVTYPYTGWVSSPVVKTEVTNTSGIAGTILVTARTVNRTATGCTVRVTLSASATGSVNVDLYLMGAVRGVLTAV